MRWRLGKALPKGSSLLVPFFCDVFIGNAVCVADHGDESGRHFDHKAFTALLADRMTTLESEGGFAPWS